MAHIRNLVYLGLGIFGTAAAIMPLPAAALDVTNLVVGSAASPSIVGTGPLADSVAIDVTPTGSTTTLTSGSDIVNGQATGSSFHYDYTFAVAAGTPGLIAEGSWKNLSPFDAIFVADTQTSTGYTIGTTAIPATTQNSPADTSEPSTLIFAGLAAGTYTIELSGALAAGKSAGSFTGNVAVLPLPGGLTLLGSALLGLSAFRVARRPG